MFIGGSEGGASAVGVCVAAIRAIAAASAWLCIRCIIIFFRGVGVFIGRSLKHAWWYFNVSISNNCLITGSLGMGIGPGTSGFTKKM
eukprot:122296-Ditylum_brightwellii.AAC.1